MPNGALQAETGRVQLLPDPGPTKVARVPRLQPPRTTRKTRKKIPKELKIEKEVPTPTRFLLSTFTEPLKT